LRIVMIVMIHGDEGRGSEGETGEWSG